MIRTTLKTLWSRKRRLASTSIAVVLGVAFLAATLILGATTKAGFRDTFTAANDGTDVVVRNATRIGSEECADARADRRVDRWRTSPPSTASRRRSPEVRGTAQLIGADGDPVGGDGPPSIAANWIDDPELAG